MKPYAFRSWALLLPALLLCSLVALGANTRKANPRKPEEIGKTAQLGGRRLAYDDPSTRSGLDHLYNLEYDSAISDFEKALKAHPDDPFAVNHLMQAVLLKELYRLDALDTTLYADNGFLTGKPLPVNPKVRERIQELGEKALALEDARIAADPGDVEALYARGATRALKLTFVALVDKSFFSALKNASGARSDHERVLKLDPRYTDAKLVLGVHNYVLGSLPLAAKVLAGIVGITGSKKKGLEYLHEVAAANIETSADARASLALFLRREARYREAKTVMQELATQYPHNFVFALEVANLSKDAGEGPESIALYEQVLANAGNGEYEHPHLERAQYGLAEALRGQGHVEDALHAYESAGAVNSAPPDVRLRALLGAAEMYDALNNRAMAVKRYQEIVAIDPDSPQSELARRYEKEPFRR